MLSIDDEVVLNKKPSISLRAERNGIGALLSNLRSSYVSPQEESSSTASTVDSQNQNSTESVCIEETARPLNRKEKRALLRSTQREEYSSDKNVDAGSSAENVSLLTKLILRYCDESSYKHYETTFGYESSRHNNYLHMVSQNDKSTYAVTTSQDRCIRTYKMNEETVNLGWKRNTGGLVLDVCWEKSSGHFFSTSKHRPIQLWNVETGELVQSYTGKDSGDNVKEAMSVGQVQNFLIAGFKNKFQLWNVEIGGDAFSKVAYFDRDYNTGITGYAMSIDSHPSMSDLFAAAGTSSRVSIYSINWKTAVTTIEGSARGNTHVKFSPDGLKVYTSERSGDIHCFDTRMNALVHVLKREMSTAHRTRFDIDETGRFLVSGSSVGNVLVYDLNDFNEESSPVLTVDVSSSCVPCVSLKNNKLVLCTGERFYDDPTLSSDDEDENRKRIENRQNSFQLFDI